VLEGERTQEGHSTVTPIEIIVISSGLALTLYLASRILAVAPLPSTLLAITSLMVAATFFHPSSALVVSSDANYYWNWADDIRSKLDAGVPLEFSNLWPGKGLWPLILAVLDAGFGGMVLISITTNALLLGLTIQISQKTASVILGRKVSSLSALAVFCSPSLVLFGASPLRETIFWLGAALMLLGFVTFFYARRRLLGAVEVFIGSAVLLAIRPDASYPVVLYFFVGGTILWLAWRPDPPRLVQIASASIFVSGLVLSAPASFSFLSKSTPLESAEINVIDIKRNDLSSESVTTRFENLATLPTPVTDGICEIETTIYAICRGIETLPSFFLGPFPWEINVSPISVFLSLSSLHFLAILALFIRETAGRRHDRAFKIFVLGAVLLSALLFSTVSANYGIITRFKVLTMFILASVSQVALQRLLDRLILITKDLRR
jgi:hypothetical protein